VSNGKSDYQLWTRDVVDLALELFADPQFAGETALGFKLEMRNGMRLFEEYHTGDWFKAAQVSLALSFLSIFVQPLTPASSLF